MGDAAPAFSEDYYRAIEEYRQFHKREKTCSGKIAKVYIARIKAMIERLGAKSVLDYGCGKGAQYKLTIGKTGLKTEDYWGVPVTKYDPGVEEFSGEPEGTFDLVICTHALSHIPMSDVGKVVDRLYTLSVKGIFVAEQLLRPPKKWVLPEGMVRPGLKVGVKGQQKHGLWEIEDWVRLLKREGTPQEVVFCAKTPDGKREALVNAGHPPK